MYTRQQAIVHVDQNNPAGYQQTALQPAMQYPQYTQPSQADINLANALSSNNALSNENQALRGQAGRLSDMLRQSENNNRQLHMALARLAKEKQSITREFFTRTDDFVTAKEKNGKAVPIGFFSAINKYLLNVRENGITKSYYVVTYTSYDRNKHTAYVPTEAVSEHKLLKYFSSFAPEPGCSKELANSFLFYAIVHVPESEALNIPEYS